MKATLSVKGSLIPFTGNVRLCHAVCSFLLILATFITPAFSQTTPLTFTQIAYDDPDIISPGRGAEQWHSTTGSIANPVAGNGQQSLDVYYRFTWNRLEGSTQDSYNWNAFDSEVRDAIDKGQKFSFGIMSCFPGGSGNGIAYYDNGDAAYPEYLHRLMQGESFPDWKTTGHGPTGDYGSWVPNWNSPHYLDRLRALNAAIYAHINSTSYTAESGPHRGKTIAFKDVIFSIDIRGYGSWGEWHNASIVDDISDYPEGTRPTATTLKTIIDHHVNVFTNHPLSIMMSTFDAERYPSMYIPKEVTAYALSVSNNWGKLGWRRDNWGATDGYIEVLLKDNDASYGASGLFKDLIMERWKYAPITGEPAPWLPSLNGCGFDDLERQVRVYHATSFGNGNYGSDNPPSCAQDNIRSAFKAAGYRIILEGGNVSSTVQPGANLAIALQWKNIGIAPTYEKWDVVFELKNSDGGVVWSHASTFSPGAKGSSLALLPSSQATASNDQFTLPATLTLGNYNLDLVIKDPSGYRPPLPLAINGRNADGSYTLKTITVDGNSEPIPPVEVPPVLDCSSTTATISNTPNCNNQGFDLILSSAVGVGPFDITINGTTYNNIPVGGTITSIAGSGTVSGRETIWTSTPEVTTYEDSPVELGVKFMTSSAGTVSGIRFFSASHTSGEYTGHLWDANGNQLASATFGNVTPNGWQEVLFSEPVAIVPGVVYVASYYNPAGAYAATGGGLGAGVSNGPLTLLGSDTEGGNGVYNYDGGFPTNTFNSTNYWVDVIFNSGASPQALTFNLTSVTGSNGCSKTGQLQTLTVSPSDCAVAEKRSAVTESTTMAAPPENKKQAATIFKDDLSQNYPNPSRGETVINYSLSTPSRTNLSLFDVNGRLVKVLVNGIKEAGTHTVRLNGGSLTAGVYFYRLQTGNFSAVKRMVVQN